VLHFTVGSHYDIVIVSVLIVMSVSKNCLLTVVAIFMRFMLEQYDIALAASWRRRSSAGLKVSWCLYCHVYESFSLEMKLFMIVSGLSSMGGDSLFLWSVALFRWGKSSFRK